jgi:hypothetical protein
MSTLRRRMLVKKKYMIIMKRNEFGPFSSWSSTGSQIPP